MRPIIRLYVFMFAALLLLPTCLNGKTRQEEKVVAYAKAIDVKMLDNLLPSMPLGEWLSVGPPHATKVDWRVSNDCDLKGDRSKNHPLCIKVVFRRGADIAGWALIGIGTIDKGISGTPTLRDAIVQTTAPPLVSRPATRLSEIPSLMDELSK